MAENTWNETAIEEKVREIVSNYLQAEPTQVTRNSHLVDDLGADSLDLTELAVAFEDAFGLEIPDSEFSKLMTIAGVVDYVKSHVA